MKVVIVNEGLAYPPKGGNWLRTLNLMLPLASRHEITYVCRGAKNRDAVETARAFFAANGVRFIVTPDHPAENRGPMFPLRVGANLFSPLPYSIASHRSPAVRREVRRLHAAGDVDVFQFEALGYADTLAGTDARTLVMAHNVESLIWQRLHETERRPLKRWVIGRQYAKYERYERRVLRAATRVVAVSREDAALLHARFGTREVPVVDNGVDVTFFAADAADRRPEPKRIIFVGSLDWRPNLDSIELLLDRIMPRVLAMEPEARLSIVGRNPPPGLVRRLQSLSFAELHADVPDVRPFLQRSAVMAVPLRIGGGSRLKILEAAAASLPVVSTRVGCEGLIFEAGRDLLVVDDEEGMAAALVACLRDPGTAAAMASRARAVVDRYYDWSRLALKLEAVWHDIARAPVRR